MQSHGPEQRAGPLVGYGYNIGLMGQFYFMFGISLINRGVNLYIFLCVFSLMAGMCLVL